MNLRDIKESQLLDALPHGSGIDGVWSFDRLKNGNIRCHNSYHMMNDVGMYDGWQDFTVTLFAHPHAELNKLSGPCAGQWQIVHLPGDIDCVVTLSTWTYRARSLDLRNYLSECVQYSLSDAGILSEIPHLVAVPLAMVKS